MARDTGTAWAAALEALRGFRFHQYAPFAWILAAQLVSLTLAMNLGTAWGMGTMGWLADRVAGDGPLHYPVFFVFLPNLMSYIEVFLYALVGSVLIPLALIRIQRAIEPETAASGSERSRVWRAVPIVLVGTIASVAVPAVWQWVLTNWGLKGVLRGLLRAGLPGSATIWLIGLVGSYAIWTLFIYIPVVAVRPGRSFGGALREGMRAGLGFFVPTFLVVFALSLPATFILFLTQVLGGFLVGQIRPEVIGYLIGIYSVFTSLAIYFIYSAAYRHYTARRAEAT